MNYKLPQRANYPTRLCLFSPIKQRRALTYLLITDGQHTTFSGIFCDFIQ